jgi:3-hydroxyisobutyrate dehydrogenase-like beta-hydroxyacid dehydrogenase
MSTNERRHTVGFIGLGKMGGAIAGRLVAAGYDVVGWNRSRQAVDELVSRGGRPASTAAEAAAAPEVHTMLADDAALADILDRGGVLEALRPGSVHVNHATVSVAFARHVSESHARRGLGYVAAPVFGRPSAAAEGKLHVLGAGAAAHVARVRGSLEAVGQSLWLVGDAPERANVIKIAGNFMIAAAIEAMGEAAALARANGVSSKELLDVLTGTLFAAPVYRTYAAIIADRSYDPAGFELRLGFKDTRLALASAEELHVPMPFAAILRDAFLDSRRSRGRRPRLERDRRRRRAACEPRRTALTDPLHRHCSIRAMASTRRSAARRAASCLPATWFIRIENAVGPRPSRST